VPSLSTNGIRIAYDEFGREESPAVILIMGLYCQLIDWPVSFCEKIADAGYRAIRFDNRDIGLSSHLDHLSPPSLAAYGLSMFWGARVPAPYDLDDMAEDTLGLMDALNIDRAHLVGSSMGGIIAQLLAAGHPERVCSLCCLSSTTGNPWLPPPDWRVLQLVTNPAYIFSKSGYRQKMELMRLLTSPAYPKTEEDLESWIAEREQRSPDSQGLSRQLAASLRTGNISSRLRKVCAPTLVLHGDSDPLVPYTSGQDIAKQIEGARFELIEGWAHDFPEELSGPLAEKLVAHLESSPC
jgi:pimeloyl-ACP methyl ester carboxylesterase